MLRRVIKSLVNLPNVFRISTGMTKPLIVMGHIRSGSTLLMHILKSNPQVLGFGEGDRNYLSDKDLYDLTWMTLRRQERLWVHERYVMDKIVWDMFEIGPAILANPAVMYIVLLREPASAFSSIKNVLADWQLKWTDAEILGYYRTRLNQIESYALSVDDPTRIALLTYEDIVNRTEDVFSNLEAFLGLTEPLQESYATDRYTGTPQTGDTEGLITTGAIDRSPKTLLPIDECILQEAHWVFAQKIDSLKKASRFSLR